MAPEKAAFSNGVANLVFFVFGGPGPGRTIFSGGGEILPGNEPARKILGFGFFWNKPTSRGVKPVKPLGGAGVEEKLLDPRQN